MTTLTAAVSTDNHVASHPVVPRSEWVAARLELLKQEKALTRQYDRLRADRLRLPWVKVDKPYRFDAPGGKATLADLFGGRSQLLVYHFMLGPDWAEGCPSCSFVADHHQDRSRWDRAMIARGLMHLGRSADGDELSEYHLHAGIAACHCTAADDASTDWPRILSLYDRWAAMNDSPVVALNRAVAVAAVHGPAAGLDAVAAIQDREALESYDLLYAVLAEFESQLGRHTEAAAHLRDALRLTDVTSERAFLSAKLAACEGHAAAPAGPLTVL